MRYATRRERAVYRGLPGQRLAKERARLGDSGVVVDVLYPPVAYPKTVHPDWKEILVRVDSSSDLVFRIAGEKIEPRWVPCAPGPIDLEVTTSSGDRHSFSTDLPGGYVQVLSIRPRLGPLSIGARRPALLCRSRYQLATC
jgi:hypothetical protein